MADYLSLSDLTLLEKTESRLNRIEEEILPYAGLKTLIIERDMKEPMPVFRDALKSVL